MASMTVRPDRGLEDPREAVLHAPVERAGALQEEGLVPGRDVEVVVLGVLDVVDICHVKLSPSLIPIGGAPHRRSPPPTRISAWSCPSSMTRSSGSVPEYRTSSRPASPSRARRRATAAATCGHLRQVPLLAHPHVQQHLRIRREVAAPGRARSRPVAAITCEHVERRDEAVAREEEVREDDVARLLAAERQVARSISSITYLSPTGHRISRDAASREARSRGRCCS